MVLKKFIVYSYYVEVKMLVNWKTSKIVVANE